MADFQAERALRRRLPVLVHAVMITHGIEGDVRNVAVFADRIDTGSFERYEGDPAALVLYGTRRYTIRHAPDIYAAQFQDNVSFTITDGGLSWSIRRVGEVEDYGRAGYIEIDVERRLRNV